MLFDRIVKCGKEFCSKVINPATLTMLFSILLSGVCLAAEAEHGGGGGAQFKDFLYRLLNFTILVVVMYMLLKKPAGNFFANRRESIRRTLEELEQKKAEAERKYKEYEGKLAALDKETKSILDEYLEDGEREREKIIDAAKKQAQYIKEQAKFAIRQEVKVAKAELQQEIAEMTVSTAGEILKKNIKRKDHNRLIEDFKKKVVKAK